MLLQTAIEIAIGKTMAIETKIPLIKPKNAFTLKPTKTTIIASESSKEEENSIIKACLILIFECKFLMTFKNKNLEYQNRVKAKIVLAIQKAENKNKILKGMIIILEIMLKSRNEF